MTLPENEECQSESPPAKKLKREESPQPSTSTWFVDYSLLDFCDDLLLEIFSHLKPIDLITLGQCCKRLQRIVRDRVLWKNVDFRQLCISDKDLTKYCEFLLPTTRKLAVKGLWVPPHPRERGGELRAIIDQSYLESRLAIGMSANFFNSLTKAAPNLHTLIIENSVLDTKNLTWDKVPSNLEYLSLQHCHLFELDASKSFFYGIDKSLRNLKTLNLRECYWFESHSLLTLSKCEKLEELRLADCLLSDFVPYVSLGTRFGFKTLTIIDFSRTYVTDREISCLNKTPNLRELYLESPGGVRGSTLISDMAVTAFGATLEVWNQLGYFVLLMPEMEEEEGSFLPSPLRVIQLLNYRTVTDTSLRHCASCLKGLQRIDVRGTSCSQAGVIKFKSERPDVTIMSDFNLEVEAEADAGSSVDNT
uniref:F-box domain-containing protein n=1 Tax=Cuerna arida TaxID=1464854 RepID=A0A1B6GBK3_9HEMI